MWRRIIFQVRARVLQASSLPTRNGLAGGGLVGSIFHGRWCVIFTCLCLPQLRERSEQWSGDLGIAHLGGVTALNIQRLVYRPSDVAWDAITSHPLLFVLRHPAAPPLIRLQVARTLDDILRNRPTPRSPRNCAASRAGRSGTADHAGWTPIQREHGAPLLGP
jgi:hypothetical protein